jgi:hypothetical protein
MSCDTDQPTGSDLTSFNRLIAYKLSVSAFDFLKMAMSPIKGLSEEEIQLINDPTRSVKRPQLVSLCRKASLKVKGTVISL